jgi:hypothetical protein
MSFKAIKVVFELMFWTNANLLLDCSIFFTKTVVFFVCLSFVLHNFNHQKMLLNYNFTN